MKIDNNQFKNFVVGIKNRIISSQKEALRGVNKELINLYWDIGKSISKSQEENGWGKSVVENLSFELRRDFVGVRGFSVQNLWNMRQFYLQYSKNEKLQTLSREIGWSHNVMIFQKCKDELEREFYIKSVIKFGWSYRVLDNQIANQTYEKYLLKQTNLDKTLPPQHQNAFLALKDSKQPIGVASYKLTKTLPKNLKDMLPSSKEIALSLEAFLDAKEYV